MIETMVREFMEPQDALIYVILAFLFLKLVLVGGCLAIQEYGRARVRKAWRDRESRK